MDMCTLRPESGQKVRCLQEVGMGLDVQVGVCPREYEKGHGMGQGLGAHSFHTTQPAMAL